MPDLSRHALVIRYRLLLWCVGLAMWLPLATAPDFASAAEDASRSSSGTVSVETRQQQVRAQVEALEKTLEQLNEKPAAAPQAPVLRQRLELLNYAEVILAQRQAAQIEQEELSRQLEEMKANLQSLNESGLEETSSHSFLLLDKLKDELASAQAMHDSVEAEIDATRDLIQLARKKYDEKERDRHAAKETLRRNRNPADIARLTALVHLAEVSSVVAHETILLHDQQLGVTKLKAAINDSRRASLNTRIELLELEATFSKSDLETLLNDLARIESELKRKASETQAELKQIDLQWLDAKQQAEQSDDPLAHEAVESWSVARQCRQKEIASLTHRLGQIAVTRFCWQCRFEVLNHSASDEDMLKWREAAEDYRQRHDRARRLVQIDMESCRNQVATVEDRLAATHESNPALAPWLRLRGESYEHLAMAFAAELLEADRMARLLDRVYDELSAATKVSSAADWLATSQRVFASVWRYEITSVDDEPITVSDVIVAAGLCLLGFFISRRVSRGLGRKLLPRFGLAEGNAAAMQTILFYLLFIIFGYFSLELIGIPLTVFAFLGGAIAIGVGFGSQNILNNFISGIILLFERPIRVGDLVDVDGLYGTIEHVGARSTRVRTGSNLEIIVPNSRFLENNVTNMTLSDERFRASVCVGVAYGSPTRTVAEILEQAALEHNEVMQEPRPIILFKDFGSDSLNFEVHFWIRMRTIMQGQRIESEVRHRLDELFKQANITIAFPQRDIHLDASAPIEVRLQSGSQDDASITRFSRAA